MSVCVHWFIFVGKSLSVTATTGSELAAVRSPLPTSKGAIKNRFSAKKSSSKVSPLKSTHSPLDPLMRDTETTTIDFDHHVEKKNLLHTIKIYLHGSTEPTTTSKSPMVFEAINGDCCNSTPLEKDDNAKQCDDGEPDQLCRTIERDRSAKLSLTSTGECVLRDSVNTSLSIICSAAAVRTGKRFCETDTKAVNLLDNIGSSAEPQPRVKPMSSPAANTEHDDAAVLESLQDSNLDSEFREVLHFNIGHSIRNPPVLRGNLRHVTSLESSDEEAAVATAASISSEADREECVSEQKPTTNKRPTRRLIPFHKLDDERTASSGPDSLEEEYYSGVIANELGGSAVSSAESSDKMPAHGDLIMDPANDDTVFGVVDLNEFLHFVDSFRQGPYQLPCVDFNCSKQRR